MVILFPILGIVAILCVPLSTFLLTMAYEQSRFKRCTGCGYDLRGLPTRRCPECGGLNPKLREHMPALTRGWLFALGLLAAALPVALIVLMIVTVLMMSVD